MPQDSKGGSVAIASGTAAGWTVASTLGNVGLVAGGTAFSVGAAPIMGAGAVAGAAAYGAYRGVTEGDPLAFSSLGLGAAAGAGLSASIGGVGIVGGFGGVGLGLGSMTAMGGIAGLGLYGIAKMLDSGPKESAFAAFSHMEERINDDLTYDMAYTSALIELSFPEDDILRTILEYEADADLALLRQEVQQVDPKAWVQAEQKAQASASAGTSSTIKLLKIHELHHHSADINALAFHPDQTHLFTASNDKTISCVNVMTGRRQYCLHSPNPTLDMAINPVSHTMLSGGEAPQLTNWNLATRGMTEMLNPEPQRYQSSSFVHAVCSGSQGKVLASAGADQQITLWHQHEFQKLNYRPFRWLKGHRDTIFSVALSANEQHLASASADNTVRIWDLRSWNPPKILQGHKGYVYQVAICPTHPLLASAGQDGTLRFWNLETGTLLQTIQVDNKAIRFLVFSPDGSLIISSGNNQQTVLWSVVDQENLGQSRSIQLKRQMTITGCGPAGFNQAGTVLATSDQTGKLKLWRLCQP